MFGFRENILNQRIKIVKGNNAKSNDLISVMILFLSLKKINPVLQKKNNAANTIPSFLVHAARPAQNALKNKNSRHPSESYSSKKEKAHVMK